MTLRIQPTSSCSGSAEPRSSRSSPEILNSRMESKAPAKVRMTARSAGSPAEATGTRSASTPPRFSRRFRRDIPSLVMSEALCGSQGSIPGTMMTS